MLMARYIFLFLRSFRRFFSAGSHASHHTATLYQRAALLPFLDSGAWDYCLGQLFDVTFRGGFVFSLLALSEHGWGERAVGRFWAALTCVSPALLLPAGGFYHFIFLLLRAFLLVFWLLGFYVFACGLSGFKWVTF
jgi:hypothetical protein